MAGKNRKKGESLWISFVLLMGFMVVLGTFVYAWLVGYVKTSGDDVKKVVYNYEKCDSISVSIDSACAISQNLYIRASNRNNLRINALVFTAFDQSGFPEARWENVTIKPGKSKEIQLSLNISNVAILQAVPVMHKDDLIIVCSERKAQMRVIAC